jgi:disulfide oxidoreductase YuzD
VDEFKLVQTETFHFIDDCENEKLRIQNKKLAENVNNMEFLYVLVVIVFAVRGRFGRGDYHKYLCMK